MDELDSLIERFEAAWQRGEFPEISAYLPTGDDEQFLSALLELACIDLEYRWPREQDRRTAEDYVEQFPELADSNGHLAELALQEYRCQLRSGIRPDHAIFAKRFPQLGSDFDDVLKQVDSEFAASLDTRGRSLSATKWLKGMVGDPGETLAKESGQSSSGTSDELPTDLQDTFELREEIARGGMGCVYLGYDRKLEREVAIKTLLPHTDPSRFVIESKITAKLPHPGIPPVHTLGELSDGSPFLAMKLVRGETLKEALQARADLTKDLLHFVQVFEQVAQAVGFAHAKGIIHRDLKPANVMLGAFGEVQVMDWGIAKELANSESSDEVLAGPLQDFSQGTPETTCGGQTTAGNIMGTPGYMAPEQARAEMVGPPADVFALGGILKTILTGQPTFSGLDTWASVQAAAAGETQPALDRLADCKADPDLIAIAEKCLEIRPEDRPANGHAVAKLVAAYRESVQDRLRQAEADRAAAILQAEEQRKRRRLVLMGGIAVVSVLTLGVVGTGFGLIRAEQARVAAVAAEKSESRRAEAERLAKEDATRQKALAQKSAADEKRANLLTEKRLAEIEKLNDTVFDIFDDFDIEAVKEGSDPLEYVLAERLIQAGKDLNEEAIQDPVVLAKMKYRLGQTLLGLGRPQDAVAFLEASKDIRERELGAKHPDTLVSVLGLATAQHAIGQTEMVIPVLEQTLKSMQEVLGNNHADTLMCLGNLASAYNAMGELKKAVSLQEEVLKGKQEALGAEHPSTLATMNSLAATYYDLGQYDQAIPLLEKTLQLRKQELGEKHPRTVTTMGDLGLCCLAAGQTAKALPLLEKTVEIEKKILGPDHPDTLISLGNLADGYQYIGELEKALPLFEEAFELTEAKLGRRHPDTISSMDSLARCYRSDGQLKQAVSLHEETLKLRKEILGEEHPDTFSSINELASTYMASGKADLAQPLYEEAFKLRKTKLGPKHPETLSSMNDLALCYQATDKLDQALPLFEETLVLMKEFAGADHPVTLKTAGNLATAYCDAQEYEKAKSLSEETLELMKEKLGADHPNTLVQQNNLGSVYRELGELELSVNTLETTLGVMKEKLGLQNPYTLNCMSNLGSSYMAAGRLESAFPTISEAYQRKMKVLGPEHPDTISTRKSMLNLVTGTRRLLVQKAAAKNKPHVLSLTKLIVANRREFNAEGSLELAAELNGCATCLIKVAAFAEAEQLLSESVDIYLRDASNFWITYDAQVSLGIAMAGQGKLAEAEPLLLAGYQGMKEREENIPPRGKPRLRTAVNAIIKLYEHLDKPDEKKQWEGVLAEFESSTPPQP